MMTTQYFQFFAVRAAYHKKRMIGLFIGVAEFMLKACPVAEFISAESIYYFPLEIVP